MNTKEFYCEHAGSNCPYDSKFRYCTNGANCDVVEEKIKQRILKYKFMWAWHKRTGSYDYYIINLIEKAAADNAPETAVYYDNFAKKWVLLEEACEATQNAIRNYVEKQFG